MTDQLLSRIFVVDDERVIAETLTTILARCGFSATSFTNPLEALKTARSAAPDLLISDVVMPQLSGIELAIEIKEHCPSCKILLLSGQAGIADLLWSARQKGHNFLLLSKPIHPTDLLNAIRNLAQPRSPVALPAYL